MIEIFIFITVVLILISNMIGDVKNEIPFLLLIIETIMIFVMAYLERENDDEENKDRWLYVGTFFFALIAITYLIFNYNLQ